MNDPKSRLQPLLDADGNQVTLFGLPMVINPDLPPVGDIILLPLEALAPREPIVVVKEDVKL